jgi:hypothetical protein
MPALRSEPKTLESPAACMRQGFFDARMRANTSGAATNRGRCFQFATVPPHCRAWRKLGVLPKHASRQGFEGLRTSTITYGPPFEMLSIATDGGSV